jgi:hypothetical protein
MNSGGSIPIRLPIEATNNYASRPLLDKETLVLLSNPKIPPPNFAGIDEKAYKAGLSKIQQLQQKQKEIQTNIDSKAIEINEATQNVDRSAVLYAEASNNLPAGDPAIAAAMEMNRAAKEKIYALREEKQDLINNLPNV